jgi:hypothetical protein
MTRDARSVIKERDLLVKRIVEGEFKGAYLAVAFEREAGYPIDGALPFIIMKVNGGIVEVPVTHPAFTPILNDLYNALDERGKVGLLAYEAYARYRIEPYEARLLILDVRQLAWLNRVSDVGELVRLTLEHPLSHDRAVKLGGVGVEWLVRRMIEVGLLAVGKRG